MDLLRHRRELNRGFGDALSRAFELAVTTALFFVVGLLLDRWLGTTPLFMISITVFVLVGQFVRIWYAYDAEMRKHEAERKRVQGGLPE